MAVAGGSAGLRFGGAAAGGGAQEAAVEKQGLAVGQMNFIFEKYLIHARIIEGVEAVLQFRWLQADQGQVRSS